jgi:hypothetical protein
MADILSNLYHGYSMLWYHQHHIENTQLKMSCLNYINNEIEHKMNLVIANYPNELLKILLIPLKNNIKYDNFEDKNKLFSMINNNSEIYSILKQDIYSNNTPLEKMEKIRNISKNTNEYNELYNDIISVGEFKIDTIPTEKKNETN